MEPSPSSKGPTPVPGQPFIAIAWSTEKGRHVVTTQAVRAGQLVMQQEPYCSVLAEEQVPHRCDFCFQSGENLMRCGRSKLARYCKREHQKAAWDRGYNEECAALVAWAPRVPPATLRLAARAAWRARREAQAMSRKGSKASQVASPFSSWEGASGLLSHWESLEPARKVLYAGMGTAARRFAEAGVGAPTETAISAEDADAMQDTDSDAPTDAAQTQGPGALGPDGLPSVRAMAHLLSRFACNAHTICDEELRPLGTGLYPLAAMANHSCAPSCMQSFRGHTICFRALRDMSAGEEVTIAYVELGVTRQQRREALAEQYLYDPESAVAIQAVAGSAAQGPGVSEVSQPQQQQLVPGAFRRLRPPPAADVWVGPGGVVPAMAPPASDAAPAAGPAASDATALGRSTAVAQPCAEQASTEGSSLPGDCSPGPLDVRARVYGLSSHPPWPYDSPKDEKLTQLLLLLQQPAGSGAPASAKPWLNNAVSREATDLPGGLQARMVEVEDGAADVLQSFAGLAGEDEDEDASTPSSRGVTAPQHVSAGSDAHPEVDCWGPWAAAFVAEQQHVLAATAAQQQREEAAGNRGLAGGMEVDAPHTASSLQTVAAEGVQLCVASLARAVGGVARTLRTAQARAAAGEPGPAADMLLSALRTAGSMRIPTLPIPLAPQAQSAAAPRSVVVALGPCHGLRIMLGAAALKALIDEGQRWPLALDVARELGPAYEAVYPLVWPLLGLHHATHAKLAMLLEQPREALGAADKALRILAVTHAGVGAAGGGVLEEVGRIRWEAGQELAAAMER